jgi:hypothetical protein
MANSYLEDHVGHRLASKHVSANELGQNLCLHISQGHCKVSGNRTYVDLICVHVGDTYIDQPR